jgi:hypothetical protein
MTSGKEVPIPIIVTPIINFDSPMASPIFSALSKSQSAPFTKTAKEIKKIIIQKIILIYYNKKLPTMAI